MTAWRKGLLQCECTHSEPVHDLNGRNVRTCCSMLGGPKGVPCDCRRFVAAQQWWELHDLRLLPLGETPDQPAAASTPHSSVKVGSGPAVSAASPVLRGSRPPDGGAT